MPKALVHGAGRLVRRGAVMLWHLNLLASLTLSGVGRNMDLLLALLRLSHVVHHGLD